MDHIVDWLTYFGNDLFVVFIATIVILAFYYRFQTQLRDYIHDSPLPTLVVDSSGRILVVNRPAMRLLVIRQVGKTYFLPHPFCEKQLRDNLKNIQGNSFKKRFVEWTISDTETTTVEVSGRKNRYRGMESWLLYVTPYDSPDEALNRERTRLKVSNTVFDSLSELIYVKDEQGNIVGTNKAFDRFWRGRVEEGGGRYCRADEGEKHPATLDYSS